MHNFIDDLLRILEITVPIMLFMWANKRTAKRENEKRHKENQDKIAELVSERDYLPPHGHIEEAGPLQAEGIIRKPTPRH